MAGRSTRSSVVNWEIFTCIRRAYLTHLDKFQLNHFHCRDLPVPCRLDLLMKIEVINNQHNQASLWEMLCSPSEEMSIPLLCLRRCSPAAVKKNALLPIFLENTQALTARADICVHRVSRKAAFGWFVVSSNGMENHIDP